MIDKIGQEKRLRRELANLFPVFLIVCRSALRARKPAREARDKEEPPLPPAKFSATNRASTEQTRASFHSEFSSSPHFYIFPGT